VIWTVAKKELRGYFNSAVAVIFLAAFLAVAFYTFFWQEKFFARGIADLRPLFEWMPRLLIIIVAALAMRLWADERKAGTLEVLLTLPIARWRLVLGKFVAGMSLIAIALGLTLGLPLTISHMGHLDWGPVIGGYLAALLLSAAYLSIGMCVSALTDNQIVAFILTALLCLVAYAVGDLDWWLGRFLGTGVRFESISRGVVDIRDLAYYAGIVAVGLSLNVVLLQRLSWASGDRARSKRVAAVLGVVLIAANAVALDAWLAPVRRARVDLTQSGAFSLSPSTTAILNSLDEPLLIRGYFSEKTHPKIAPLVPQMRDLLDEYRIAGGNKVRVEIVDPGDDEAARKEAKERFGIDPTPLRFATQTEKSVVDAYFAVAIEYGDHHAVLTLDDLIQVRAVDMGDIEITLKNPEYQITKTIKKTVSQFASVDALFASMPGKVTLTAYLTPKSLPDNWKAAPQKLDEIVAKLKKQAGGKLDYNVVEPKTDAEMKDLFDKYGVRPYEDIFANSLYYFSVLVQVGDRIVRIAPPQTLEGKELETSINDGLKRAAPGFTRVVGMWTPPELPPMGGEGMPQQPIPPAQAFKLLERTLGGNYEVRPIPLFGAIPDDVEVMIVAGPADLGDDQAKAIDQFVMRGGALIVLDGRYRLAQGAGLAIEKVNSGLDKMLKAWGITVGEDVVLDAKSEKLPIPVDVPTDAGNMRQIFDGRYPFFIRLDGDELASHLITEGLAGAVMHWASPVKAETKVGGDTHVVEPLLTSSPKSWLRESPKAMPDPATYPKTGFPGSEDVADDKKGPQVLAVAVTGGFTSAYAPDKPGAGSGSAAAGAGSGSGSGAEHLIAHSPPDTRIVVFGSSAFASDDMQQLSQQLESDLGMADLELVHNAVDWSLADTDLLAIRSRNSGAAHAITIDPDSASSWRMANLIIAALLLAGVIGFAWFRRRAVRPVIDPTVPVVKEAS
jgi:ABC-2 type transport system permease protein